LGKVDTIFSEREIRKIQKKYSKEFKREAVRFILVHGLTGVEGAQEVGGE
jgi:transposase-like protein